MHKEDYYRHFTLYRMKTKYLGLDLSSPIIVSSSPYTATVASIEQCFKGGAGAVVLKSIFEEQITRDAARYEASIHNSGDAGEYLSRYMSDAYKGEFIQLVENSSQIGAPIIASINCISTSNGWIDYASSLAQAGASALELNIFIQPTGCSQSGQELEADYIEIVKKVCESVSIPVSVKLPMRLTNFLSLSEALMARGAKGIVMFNRLFELDIDIENMEFKQSNPFSEASELRNVLRSVGLASRALPQMDLSVSTGVHNEEDVVKSILCGAHSVQICSAIHNQGFEVIGKMNNFLESWTERHGFSTLEEFRGKMKFDKDGDSIYSRVQYMKYFPNNI